MRRALCPGRDGPGGPAAEARAVAALLPAPTGEAALRVSSLDVQRGAYAADVHRAARDAEHWEDPLGLGRSIDSPDDSAESDGSDSDASHTEIVEELSLL